MVIEIHKLELENFILEQMASGKFETVEDVFMQALKPSSSSESAAKTTLGQFLLESPLRDSGLKLERLKDSPRSPSL